VGLEVSMNFVIDLHLIFYLRRHDIICITSNLDITDGCDCVPRLSEYRYYARFSSTFVLWKIISEIHVKIYLSKHLF